MHPHHRTQYMYNIIYIIARTCNDIIRIPTDDTLWPLQYYIVGVLVGAATLMHIRYSICATTVIFNYKKKKKKDRDGREEKNLRNDTIYILY